MIPKKTSVDESSIGETERKKSWAYLTSRGGESPLLEKAERLTSSEHDGDYYVKKKRKKKSRMGIKGMAIGEFEKGGSIEEEAKKKR